jgi:hypothetical protein
MDWLQDAWNQDGGKKRQAEEQRQMRLARAKADREQRMEDEEGGAFGHAGLGFAMDTHKQGLANHSAAAGAINSAISGEMQSRVAQEREKRRMEHEKYLANMRVQMAQKEQEGNIIRSLLNG